MRPEKGQVLLSNHGFLRSGRGPLGSLLDPKVGIETNLLSNIDFIGFIYFAFRISMIGERFKHG
jgi:hypothetical protein